MYQFSYTIKDPVGIHARPAGLLSKEGKKYKSAITVEKNGTEVNVLKLMALMKLGVKCGETVNVKIEGEDEAVAGPAMEAFFNANL
ncbi:MAG: HPr family phosphocarrier protein [Clostridia bacterium]|nr:HPr family phosphocarrier protein [Clostridia bacterium]